MPKDSTSQADQDGKPKSVSSVIGAHHYFTPKVKPASQAPTCHARAA